MPAKCVVPASVAINKSNLDIAYPNSSGFKFPKFRQLLYFKDV